MTDRHDEIVEIAGVTKRFPGVVALNHVSVGFRSGEVHAVVGENGAGKSTLINVLAGEFPPNEGELRIDGKPVRFASPLDSRAAGIVVVYQELALCPTMSVAENVMMSELAARPVASLVPRQRMRTETRAALARLGMPKLDPDAKVVATVDRRDAACRDRVGGSSAGARPRARRTELRHFPARKRAAVRRHPATSQRGRRGRLCLASPVGSARPR